MQMKTFGLGILASLFEEKQKAGKAVEVAADKEAPMVIVSNQHNPLFGYSGRQIRVEGEKTVVVFSGSSEEALVPSQDVEAIEKYSGLQVEAIAEADAIHENMRGVVKEHGTDAEKLEAGDRVESLERVFAAVSERLKGGVVAAPATKEKVGDSKAAAPAPARGQGEVH